MAVGHGQAVQVACERVYSSGFGRMRWMPQIFAMADETTPLYLRVTDSLAELGNWDGPPDWA